MNSAINTKYSKILKVLHSIQKNAFYLSNVRVCLLFYDNLLVLYKITQLIKIDNTEIHI